MLDNNPEESFCYILPAAQTVEAFWAAFFLGVFKVIIVLVLFESHFSKNSGV